MKVKELIEELSKLDPEKGIWCIYDSFALIDLVPYCTAERRMLNFTKTWEFKKETTSSMHHERNRSIISRRSGFSFLHYNNIYLQLNIIVII